MIVIFATKFSCSSACGKITSNFDGPVLFLYLYFSFFYKPVSTLKSASN